MIPAYPRATYRLQFSREMTFRDATTIVPYLQRIGVSHLYTSPILDARAGSTHGYDIVDHNRLNPELGSESDFLALVEALHNADMGLIVDFVPNHMGVGYSDNAWWLNVLEWGQYSPYASFFDIDWKPSEQSLRGKVLIPVLGDQYGTILLAGELSLRYDASDGGFSVVYYDHRFPISPRDYHRLIDDLLRHSGGNLSDGTVGQLREAADAFRSLGPGKKSANGQAILIRTAGELRNALARLVEGDDTVRTAVATLCERWNGTPGDNASFDPLHQLLERQAYRLAYWRLAANEINYRRFFDINDLAAIRMERPEVFEITHQLILRYIQEGVIQGIRLDHIDGLHDPKTYLARLQDAAAYRLLGRTFETTGPHDASIDQTIYVVAEKILAGHETLRPDWQVSGTTGYDHMARVAELFFLSTSEGSITDTYNAFTGVPRRFDDTTLAAKQRTMHETLASELNVLANRLSRLAKGSRRTRDFSRLALRTALANIVAHFPVYRSYVDSDGPSEADRRDIEWAVARARKATETVDTSAYDFILGVLTTDILTTYPGEFKRREVVELAMKVQQFTAPVMAKSFEDTAFYRDARFVGRNEVGAEPDSLYTSPQGFHYTCTERLESHPFGMISTATHDHKRGEDVRARLNVLSEMSESWHEWTQRFGEYTAGMTTDIDGSTAPDRNDQFFILQTILGIWPPDLEDPTYIGIDDLRRRVGEYAVKALREAKVHTSWTAVDGEYEDATRRYIESVLNPKRSPTIVRFLSGIAAAIAPAGAVNAVSQKLLTLTVPGVPDIYQGTERWDLTLVDPDNRRPVDFRRRAEYEDHIEKVSMSENAPTDRFFDELCASWKSGTIKQYVVGKILRFRRRVPDLFAKGSYVPLEPTGPRSEHVVAFMRTYETQRIVVVVPRFLSGTLQSSETIRPERSFWRETTIVIPNSEDLRFSGILDGTTIRTRSTGGVAKLELSDLLARLPVTVLQEEQ